MKGKKVFYIALFFALIFMLFRCEGRDSREYLEERIGIPISRVYPTKNLEDLFGEFPNGFTIYQSYRLDGKFIDIELDGVEKGKPIEGTIKQIDIKSGAEEKKIAVTYDKGKYSYDNEEEARKLWPLEKFLFQEMTLNKEVLSKFKLKDTYYNRNSGGFDLEYIVETNKSTSFLGLKTNCKLH